MQKLLKRWWYWSICLLLLLFFAGAWGWIVLVHQSQSRINQPNFDRIQIGMSGAEVENIIGQPTSTCLGTISGPRHPLKNGTSYWEDGPHEISVGFSEGKAYSKHLHLARPWEVLRYRAEAWWDDIHNR